MKRVLFRKAIALSLLLIASVACMAQSMMIEISWNAPDGNYTGLMIINQDNRGVFKVKHFIAGVGWSWITQDAVLRNQYDAFGNCTSYINCYNPRTQPYFPYAADNFVIFPNGNMYTQDASGTWSTQIVAAVIDPIYWQNKRREYGL